jgi:hypothetical protein
MHKLTFTSIDGAALVASGAARARLGRAAEAVARPSSKSSRVVRILNVALSRPGAIIMPADRTCSSRHHGPELAHIFRRDGVSGLRKPPNRRALSQDYAGMRAIRWTRSRATTQPLARAAASVRARSLA